MVVFVGPTDGCGGAAVPEFVLVWSRTEAPATSSTVKAIAAAALVVTLTPGVVWVLLTLAEPATYQISSSLTLPTAGPFVQTFPAESVTLVTVAVPLDARSLI